MKEDQIGPGTYYLKREFENSDKLKRGFTMGRSNRF